MTEPKKTVRRGDARRRTERDLERFERRDSGGRFWHSLALIGSVGWPIVLLATGGAIFGRHLDDRFETGVRFTLLFLTLGTVVGTFIAFRTAAGKEA